MVLYVSTPSTQIISPELFDKVQALISARKASPRAGKTNPNYALSSVAFCACGSGVHYVSTTHGRFLHCTAHTRLGICKETAVSAVPVERAVFHEIKALFSDSEDLDAQFIELVRKESDARAKARAESVAAFNAEIATVDALLEEKMMAKIPDDPEVKATWDKTVSKLAERKRDAKAGLASVMAAISVHSMSGFRSTRFKEQLDELIEQTPYVGRSEVEVRTTALLRSVVKRIDLVRLDTRRVSVKMLFDFNSQLGGTDDPRAVVERTVEVDLPRYREAPRQEMEDRVASGALDLSEEDCADLDADEFLQRGMCKTRTRTAHKIYRAMLALTTTEAASWDVCKAVGVSEVIFQNYLAAYRAPGDAMRLGKALATMRPDLVIDHTRLDRGKGLGPKSYQQRLKEVDHPLLRHPLASTAQPNARLSDEEFEAIRVTVPSASVLFTRTALLRKVVDAFLWMVRTNNYRNVLPPDLAGNPVTLRVPDFAKSHQLTSLTKALLQHAGLLEPGEALPCPDLPNARKGPRNPP